MISKWRIAVLSTDYDLHNHRSTVIDFLTAKGVSPSAFETPDFPVTPGVHSHDACLAALERVDAAILIIDKRAGGVYFGTDEHTSITETEFINFAKLQKPYFVFVSKGAWNERHTYRTQLKKSGKSESDFDIEYKEKLSYVTSVDVIHFIDHIQDAYTTYGSSNWIYQFDEIADLEKAIEGKLTGLSQYYCYSIAKKQSQSIKNRKTSTSMMLSLGDVFSHGYYVEPSITVESGELPPNATLDEQVVSAIKNENSTLILGEAGYGKTTVLAKCFLKHFDACAKTAYNIPFYINLKSMGCAYHFDFSQYIVECTAEYLKKEPYPFMNIESIRPYFYLDSFDELSEKITEEDLNRIGLSSIFGRPFLLTCRNQYAMRYVRSVDFAGRISNFVRVNKWSRDKAQGYISNFCSINDKPDLEKNINGLLTNNVELCDILDNPLLITMLLWVIEQHNLSVPDTIKNRVQLFNEYLSELAHREIERLTIRSIDKITLLSIWSYAAWEVYYARIKNHEIRYDALLTSVREKFTNITGIHETWFEALFLSAQQKILGTFHEQFLEFLAANAILTACLENRLPFPEFLKEVVRPEINRYFRTLWNERNPNEKKVIVDNIKNLYTEKLFDDNNDAIMQRIHTIYHLSRLSYDGNTAFINSVLSREPHVSVKISLYFGAIKLGMLEKEAELYQLLSTDAGYSSSNRGYHLAYYGDIVSADNLPFADNINIEWKATLAAIMRHFHSTENSHYFLWRIDLLTMRQLIDVRAATPLVDVSKLSEIEYLIKNPLSHSYTDYQNLVVNEFELLKTVIEKRK